MNGEGRKGEVMSDFSKSTIQDTCFEECNRYNENNLKSCPNYMECVWAGGDGTTITTNDCAPRRTLLLTLVHSNLVSGVLKETSVHREAVNKLHMEVKEDIELNKKIIAGLAEIVNTSFLKKIFYGVKNKLIG